MFARELSAESGRASCKQNKRPTASALLRAFVPLCERLPLHRICRRALIFNGLILIVNVSEGFTQRHKGTKNKEDLGQAGEVSDFIVSRQNQASSSLPIVPPDFRISRLGSL